MATICSVKKTGTEYTGQIITPSLRAKGEQALTHRSLIGARPL